MEIKKLLKLLFRANHNISISSSNLIKGFGKTCDGQDVFIIGTANETYMGVSLIMQFCDELLEIIKAKPKIPILILVNTKGQRLSKEDELLGINNYFALLVELLHLAKLRGHKVISLLYSLAVSGAYLSTGLMTSDCYALSNTKIKVMDLRAMSKVTKVSLSKLEELNRSSSILSPEVENYYNMGGIIDIWEEDKLDLKLAKALKTDSKVIESRMQKKFKEGRSQGYEVLKAIINDSKIL